MNTNTQTAGTNVAHLGADSRTERGNTRDTVPASSIHYAGAKDPRVPLPLVIAGFLTLAGAAYVAFRYFHP